MILWHNRLFVVAFLNWYFRRNKKPFYGLISASKDGAWLEAFFRVFGIKSVRGSSSFRGEHALKDLLKAIKRGHPIAITPDGPKGPCYSFKSGFLSLAKLSQVPLMLFSCKCSNAWRINSWDGLFLLKPFSTIEMEILLYNEIDFSLSYDELSKELKDNLLEITQD